MLRYDPGSAKFPAAKSFKTWEIHENAKNFIFLQIRGCGSSLLTLEPPLPDEQRRSDGAAEGIKRRRGVAEVGKIRSISWRRAKEI